jgi:pimeloyl-ACP methyl ester carboxylesterase
MTMRFEKVFLAGDGLRLCADAAGDPHAPAVLFFHGGGQSRRSWRGAALRVAQAGYRALTFDLRGHGESDWAQDGDYLLDAFGRDVERLLESFDRPTALVGASRGGQAALVGGSRHPDRVSMIMLADVAPMIANVGVDPIRAFFRHSLQGFSSVDEAADALSRFLHQPRLANASGLAKAMRKDSAGRLFWHWDPKTVSPEFLNPPSEGEALDAAAARVKSPVVLVRAEHSDIVTDEGVRRFRELQPDLIVLEAKGVGHMFTGDRNEPFAESLLEYLARFAPLAPGAR